MSDDGRLAFFADSLAPCQFCCRGLFHGKRSRFNRSRTFVGGNDAACKTSLPQEQRCLASRISRGACAPAERNLPLSRRSTASRGETPRATYLVIIFEHERDSRRVVDVLLERLAKYGLTLHPEKTRLVDFRRPDRMGCSMV
jgi:hypothetical protein